MVAVRNYRLPKKKEGPVRRLGYAAVGLGLATLIFLSSVPNLRLPDVHSYSLLLVGFGAILILFKRLSWLAQYMRLKDRTAYCMSCGWYGKGKDWFRFECCPECDLEAVQLLDTGKPGTVDDRLSGKRVL